MRVTGLIQKIVIQAQVWTAYTHLDSKEVAVYRSGMETLRRFGGDSLSILRFGLRRQDHPHVQIRCAVVLHWLGQPDGMPFLIDMMQWRAYTRQDLTKELEAAFLAIGAPDAVDALIKLWKQFLDLDDQHVVPASICRIWAELRDPAVLPSLVASSMRIPGLFERTVPVFGEMAMPHLKHMANDADPRRRMLAIRTLGHIPGISSYEILYPLLCDQNPEVRAMIPRVLDTVAGPIAAVRVLSEAHRSGYTTGESVRMLIQYSPPDLHALLAGLLTRYEPRPLETDTVEAVVEAVQAFTRVAWPNAQVTPILCALLERRVDSAIVFAVVRTLGERGQSGDDSDQQARKAIWILLTWAETEIRVEAAQTLARLGEPFGLQVQDLLEAGRPQDNVLRKIRATLIGTQDMGQAVTEAAQHVANWFTRVSRETVVRFGTPGTTQNAIEMALQDPRLPEMLRRLLNNTLDRLDRMTPTLVTEEALSVTVATLRSLARLREPHARIAKPEILRAYFLVKDITPDGYGQEAPQEVAGVVREAAAQCLIAVFGPESYEMLLPGLSHTRQEILETTIQALGKLGDARAVPHLEKLMLLTVSAQGAIAMIRKGNPEMMTLLRGSSGAEVGADSLLRPAAETAQNSNPELLLRPSRLAESE